MRDYFPRLSISNCGTFAFLELLDSSYSRRLHVVHTFDVVPCPIGYIKRRVSGCQANHSVIELDVLRGGDINLGLTKVHRDDFYHPKEDDSVAYLHGIAFCRSDLIDANRFLLLGSNHEKMRLLHVPSNGQTPEIVPLSFTFAEALARLENEWERLLKVKK